MPLRRVLIGPLVAALLIPALTACDSKEAPAAAPTAAPTAIVPFTTTPAIEDPMFGKGLIERWGEDRVNRMADEFVAHVRAESWNIERLRPKPEYTAADFSGVSRHMTLNLLLEWSDILESALKGNEKDADAVGALALWDLGGDGFTFAPTGPFVVDERVGSALMLDERSHGVRVTVDYTAKIRMLKNGVPHLRPVNKQLSVEMLMVNENGWQIDHFDGTWQVRDSLPE